VSKVKSKLDLQDPGTNRQATLAGAPTRLMVVEIKDDDGNVTGHKLVSDTHKFGIEEKQIVIRQLADHGRIGAAARAAGVTIKTVKRHVKDDSNFAECVTEALEVYKDRLLAHHQKLVFEGEEKRSYDREGNLISIETRYPVRLIELELKKHDPGYRDKQEISHEHRGGVMVVPDGVKDADDWEKRFGKKSDIVDAEVVPEDQNRRQDDPD